MLTLELSNGSKIRCDSPCTSVRGNSASKLWYPFIDKEGNGCCTNILTGDTYLDWTKEGVRMFNIGDVVLYNKGSEAPLYDVCLIMSIKDERYNLLGKHWHSSFYSFSGVDVHKLKSINDLEDMRIEIDTYFSNLLESKLKQLKRVSFEEKEQEKVAKYNNIKSRIIANCRAITDDSLTEEEFINRVKELTNLKKQLFSPDKLECVSLVHKHNGNVKYEYKKLKENYKKALESISDEAINRFYEGIGR